MDTKYAQSAGAKTPNMTLYEEVEITSYLKATVTNAFYAVIDDGDIERKDTLLEKIRVILTDIPATLERMRQSNGLLVD